MYKNKKGFTLVELMAVVIVLIIIMLISLNLVNKQMEKSKINAFLKEANTFAVGAVQKEASDRAEGLAKDDIYHGTIYGKACYSITQKILNSYVSKTTNDYYGSVEVCYGLDCTYQTKIWITDGKHFIDGETEVSSESQIKTSFTSQYPESCGIKAIGGGSSGDLLVSNFDYTGNEQVMDILVDGVYSIEAWGAQGGDRSKILLGGYGAYAYTEVELHVGDKLYINVGEKGKDGNCATDDDTCKVSYNGGPKGNRYTAGGGGSTSVAIKSGLIYTVPINYVYIIAGAGAGGGGDDSSNTQAHRHAGGYCNNRGECGSFGVYGGVPQSQNSYRCSGGGYSVLSNWGYSYNSDCKYAQGGTSYVFNPKTKNGVMYCYNCSNSQAFTTTKTIVSPQASLDPLPAFQKMGNGFVKITYIENFTEN